MNLTSFLANKCFEYLLKCDTAEESGQSRAQLHSSCNSSPSSQLYIQPPWSLDRESFQSLCDGCGDCISACENSILTLNKNGFPQVDFSLGSCSFCGACAESCSRQVFRKYSPGPAWDLHVQINSRCLTTKNVVCSACVEQCDREAIVIPALIEKKELPQVLAESCNGCGACINSCPVNALEIIQSENQAQP